jgi:hypothetical protein
MAPRSPGYLRRMFEGLPDPEPPRRDSRGLMREWIALLHADGHDGDLRSAARMLLVAELLLGAERTIDSASRLLAEGRIPLAVYRDVVRRSVMQACTDIARLDLDTETPALN